MKRKLIIDGSAVYELDEECMLRQRADENKINAQNKKEREENKNTNRK